MTINTDLLAKLTALSKAATMGPWRYAHMIDGINARAILDVSGYHFAQIDDVQNGEAIVSFMNCRDELVAVIQSVNNIYGGHREAGCNCTVCDLADKLAALERKLGEILK